MHTELYEHRRRDTVLPVIVKPTWQHLEWVLMDVYESTKDTRELCLYQARGH